MNYILFDGAVRNALLPLTYTKPVAELRIGILTIREKWEKEQDHLGDDRERQDPETSQERDGTSTSQERALKEKATTRTKKKSVRTRVQLLQMKKAIPPVS